VEKPFDKVYCPSFMQQRGREGERERKEERERERDRGRVERENS
jgi:hypothetical protein